MMALAGTCRTCGHDLVQDDGRTYHPWDALPAGERCPDLLPLECGCPKVCYTLDVPAENFIADPVEEPKR